MQQYTHQYDSNNSGKNGYDAEINFILYAESKGWLWKYASLNNNCQNHIDFIVNINNTQYKIDVKAKKRINRSDNQTNNNAIWIELSDSGWLIGSKADYIAFEDDNNFLFVKRKELLKYIGNIYNIIKKRKQKDLFSIYQRRDNESSLTLIPKFIIEKMKDKL